MSIQDNIIKSEALIQWMDQRIDGLEIRSDERTRISAACFDVALEHQKSIVLLIANHLVGSAFSLVRVLFETYIRGLWLERCASETEIEKYKKIDLPKALLLLFKK